MSFATTRPSATVALALVLLSSLVVLALGASAAVAAQSTITPADCAAGRIHDSSGSPISQARCTRLVGKSVALASTGLDLRIFVVAGVACIGGALALRRPLLVAARRS